MWSPVSTNYLLKSHFWKVRHEAVSSVNIIGSSKLVWFFKSLTNKRNRSRPCMETCGTSQGITSKSVFSLLNSINCFLFEKYLLNHLRLRSLQAWTNCVPDCALTRKTSQTRPTFRARIFCLVKNKGKKRSSNFQPNR